MAPTSRSTRNDPAIHTRSARDGACGASRAAPRLRRLLLATAALGLCGAPMLALSTVPAQAAESAWVGGPGLKIRLVETVTRDTVEGPKVYATVSVSNAGTAPLQLSKTAGLDAVDQAGRSFSTLERRHPIGLATLPQNTMIPGESVYNFVVELPSPTAQHPDVALRLAGSDGLPVILERFSLADLRANSPRKLTARNLNAFAGRYRTNLGTLLNFHNMGEYLQGSHHTVGPNPEVAPTIELRAVSDTHLAGSVIEVGRPERSIGNLSVDGTSNTPLKGGFESGPLNRQSLVACPVANNDLGPWKDAQLRPGSVFWAKAERLDAKRLPNGKVRIDATIQVWNVHHQEQRFELWYRKGAETADQLIPDAAQDRAGAYRLKPCASARLPFWLETRIEDIDGLTFRTDLKDQPWAPLWSLSDVLAKAGPAPGAGYAGGGSSGGGSTGPSRPTTELPGPLTIPSSVREYANYGIWDFRIEELQPASDGEWQAVVRVRDAATYRVGLTGGGVVLTLFDEDGRSLQSDGRIYRASVAGSAPQLQPVPQTLWMEKGDEVRVRLRIPESQGFKPVRLRLSSGDRETLSRTWAMN